MMDLDRLLPLLRCPDTGGPLEKTADDPPRLRSPATGREFPIVGGVPRLAEQGYTASFGRQWNRYDVARPEEDAAVFTAKTSWTPADLAGRRVLDAGCGGGRYSRLAASWGATVVGVDLSDAVDKAATLLSDAPNAAVVQGDLTKIPLSEEAFDLAFSIGVLHHGPDPRGAFVQVARRVRRGGQLAVWLYRRNTLPQEWINTALRAVTTRMPPSVLEPLCAAMGGFGSVPILNRTLNKVVNFSAHPDWTLRVCDNFDWYAPRYQSHHTIEELSEWFQAEGYGDLRVLRPLRQGRLYDWVYDHDGIIGSGVNLVGTRTLGGGHHS